MLSGTQVWSRARTKALFDEEQEFIAPGLQTIALLSELAIESGRGSTLTDLDGHTYLDLNAGVSVASLGHAHPRYVAALTEQLQTVTVGSFTSRARAAASKLIAELAPGDLKRVQFFSGGSEAVEAAIKLARLYTKRTDIVGFTGGFHGKTAGVLPISDVAWKDAVGPLPTGFHIAPFPDTTRYHGSPADCLEWSLTSLRRIVLEEAAGSVAAIIVEPVQGTAGNLVPPDGFLARVLAIAREAGALLICDEMITGFGRTGLWFGSNHDHVVPDIMTTGKGMASGYPMSAVISTDTIVAAEPFSLPSASSSSYGGNPLASAAALVTISTIRDAGLVDNSARVGKRLRDGLSALAERHPSIANVRGRGLLVGFDLVKFHKSDAVRHGHDVEFATKAFCVSFFKECLANGVILMGYTPRVRIHPPLILTMEEASTALEVIDHALTVCEARYVLDGAIVGFGEVARHGHWPSYRDNKDARIVAVVDRSPERRALAASLNPKIGTFDSIDALAQARRLDFVDICTPPALHPQPILEAISHGWHVLCEKPFVLDASVLPVIGQAAERRKVAVVPVHNWKYAGILRHATGLLREGTIGELRRVEIETHRMQAAATADGAEYNWRHDPAVAGGGILLDHGWHAVYLALHWFQASPGQIRSRLEWPADGGVEREASVLIDFPGHGEASIFLTWNGTARKNVMRLIGDAGAIMIDDDAIHVSGAQPSETRFLTAISAGSHHADWFTAMLPDVLACFRDRSRARVLFDEAAQCLAIIDCAYQVDSSKSLYSR